MNWKGPVAFNVAQGRTNSYRISEFVGCGVWDFHSNHGHPQSAGSMERGAFLRGSWISDGAEADVVADAVAVGRVVVAPRRADVVEGAAPAAAALQTDRTSRGSCGVGHAC